MIVDMLVEIRSTVLALGGEKRGDTMKLWTLWAGSAGSWDSNGKTEPLHARRRIRRNSIVSDKPSLGRSGSLAIGDVRERRWWSSS